MRLLACHHRTTTPAHDSDEVGNLVAHMSLLLPEAKEQKRWVIILALYHQPAEQGCCSPVMVDLLPSTASGLPAANPICERISSLY